MNIYSDKCNVKKAFLIKLFFIFLVITIPVSQVNSYAVKYKEDWYKLYHIHYAQTQDDCIENIYWLEKAARADFCNPQFVDFKIETEEEWEKYRYLFQMHINLKLIEQHLRLGRIYDKKNIYFYDAAFRDEYLRNLEKCLSCYEAGLYYWKEAKVWCEKANESKFNFLYIQPKQNWEDERERIVTGELNYERILNREINRVKDNMNKLQSMDNSY